ncbi:serine protease inhibitor I/II-like [Octopus sinensis]|uniref:Protease inhibitor n=1 Tax=Octopus sinensis TaxID=2607531 RepID=A0A7E6F4Z0_9MOLL|nr:serine protease inhibitor I/II-like [Octopus sinensis]
MLRLLLLVTVAISYVNSYNNECTYNGKKYTGVFKIDCNTCVCDTNNKAICSNLRCGYGKGPSCTYQGRRYRVGQTFQQSCNTCKCNYDGQIKCDNKDCPKRCTYKEKLYQEGEEFTDNCDKCKSLHLSNYRNSAV